MNATSPSAFSEVHNGWLADALSGEIPDETYTTCDSCPLCRASAAAVRFSDATKCCTYWPVLPNYLVGSALADTSAEGDPGRTRMSCLVETSSAVPRGIGVSVGYQAAYGALKRHAFGREESLVCPFFEKDGGRCSIWRHRNGVCSTYHCKPVRASVGEEFWSVTKTLLASIERAVSLWCALELGMPSAAARMLPRRADGPRSMEGRDVDATPTVADVNGLWASWRGSRADFYMQCFRKARTLAWGDVLRIGGTDLESQLVDVNTALQRVRSPRNVNRLLPAPVNVVSRTRDAVFIQSYKETDPQRLDASVFHSLRLCHGQPVAELQRQALREDGVVLDQSLLRRLTDLRIVIDLS